VRVEIEITAVRFQGFAFIAFLFLSFTEVAIGNGEAGLRRGCVLETVDGGVQIAFLQIKLADLKIFFCAQRVPGWLIGRGIGCRIFRFFV